MVGEVDCDLRSWRKNHWVVQMTCKQGSTCDFQAIRSGSRQEPWWSVFEAKCPWIPNAAEPGLRYFGGLWSSSSEPIGHTENGHDSA